MRALAIVLLCATARGEELEGAVADPARWPGPNGPASHSRRSRAMPVMRDVVQAWATDLPGRALSPLVHWDGTAYVLCESKKQHPMLVAIALKDGKLLAKKELKDAPAGDIHVWGGQVFVCRHYNQLAAYRRSGRTFAQKWVYPFTLRERKTFRSGDMVVFRNEVYVISSGELLRLRPGSRQAVWTAAKSSYHQFAGAPAVCGSLVYGLSHGRGLMPTYAALSAAARANGRIVGRRLPLGEYAGFPSHRPAITIGKNMMIVRGRFNLRAVGGARSHVMLPFPKADPHGLLSFSVMPSATDDGILALRDNKEWHLWQGRQGRLIASVDVSQDLFEHPVAATVLGDIAYFGTWAADVKTGEILWRLPLKSVRFGAVPADRLVLVLTERDQLVAFKSRGGR